MRRMAAVIAVAALATGLLSGCESKESSPPQTADNEASTRPSQPQFQRLKLSTLPATLPMPPASTVPATIPATAPATAASRPTDPLATPDSAVRHFLTLASRPETADLAIIIPMLLEPPPDEQLVPMLNRMRLRLLRGATWEILETSVHGSAAAVIYRTTFRGRAEVAPFLLLNQHDRWKIILHDLSPRRYTPEEKTDMIYMSRWSDERTAALQAATTQAATTQPASLRSVP